MANDPEVILIIFVHKIDSKTLVREEEYRKCLKHMIIFHLLDERVAHHPQYKATRSLCTPSGEVNDRTFAEFNYVLRARVVIKIFSA